jgi:LysM repeat protein
MKKLVLAAALLTSLSGLASGAVAQAEELVSHTVKKGDTLWHISGGYLEDPLSWPTVWRLNPGIRNPHLIYPGQVVRIPLVWLTSSRPAAPVAAGPDLDELARSMGLSGQSLALRAVEQEMPALGEGAAEEVELARQYDRGIGMVSREIPGAGRVLGTAQGWGRAASGETVQVTAPGAAVGQQFGVYRDLGKVPARTFLGQSPGHLLAEIAIVEMVAVDGPGQRAVVRRSFAELQDGDLLGAVPERPVLVTPSPAQNAVAVSGTVLAISQQRQIAGPGDIVYLDMGREQGLVPGLRLSVRSADRSESTRPAGEIMVLRVSGDRAAALVTQKSNHEVRPGDQFGPAL